MRPYAAQNKMIQVLILSSFQVLDGNILILVHPSSGDNILYKVRDAKHIILLDSFRNEPKGMNARLYVLVKNKY